MKIYNCYKDNKGYIIPKSIIIKNNPDIIEWLSSEPQFINLFKDKPNILKLNNEWINIGIGHSQIGYLYAFVLSVDQDFINKYCFNLKQVREDVFVNKNNNFYLYFKTIDKFGYELLSLIKHSLKDDWYFSKNILELYFKNSAQKFAYNKQN